MREILIGLGIGVLVAGIAGNATANTISYSEAFNPEVDILMVAGQPTETLQWIFDITDNTGWGTPDQVFTNGTIDLTLEDDGGPGDGTEKASFTFEGGIGLTHANINGWGDFPVDASALSDGKILATLTVTSGDFYFRGAELFAVSSFTARIPNNSVPEPAAVLLFATGLVGFAGVLRYKKN